MSCSLLELIRPFQGRHNPLRGGWSVDQLEAVAEALGQPDLATAMVACSLVAEERTVGMPLRYSRSQKTYGNSDRYEGDRLMTYRRVVPAVDWLINNGYADGHKGMWHFGKQSIVEATDKLMNLVGDLVEIDNRQGAMLRDEIILRDKDGNELGFCNTDEIRLMRQQMKTINAHLASQRYLFHGAEIHIPPAVRIFNRNFRRGGRLYHKGSSYQQMPKAKRAQIKMLLEDGTVAPMVELDFESLHMALLYQAAGKRRPDGDLYAIEGFTRKLTKLATLVAINADGSEVGAITGILAEDDDLCLENSIDPRNKAAMRHAVEKLITATRRKHYRIADYFGTGAGAELMRADSDMAVQIMLLMTEKTGRCPLVLHDSFLVPVQDADLLGQVMAACLVQSHQGKPSPFPIRLGKQGIDQQERGATQPCDATGNSARPTARVLSTQRCALADRTWGQRCGEAAIRIPHGNQGLGFRWRIAASNRETARLRIRGGAIHLGSTGDVIF
ncbi:hypothetical protein PDG61_30470 [Mycolicibacterium sp. BiH015]|uniref:hypothetical protein n=1 Tax=Mycolicibacterium sp. BiH015 TaxID=3018808 RepID=UPI0022E5167C|nr:hypothetical protein [Mycolicibacterium sp. BiH015]MDA2895269.1 hypothetical protein [Mycolicibacterium sp. BiH015]